MPLGIRILALGWLTAAMLLQGNDANAQAHQPPQAEYQADTPVEMDVWLRRLVGNYKLDGMFKAGDCDGGLSVATRGSPPPSAPPCTGIKGTMNCIAVGDGPGVQCIINATWTLYVGSPQFELDLSSFLDPAMSLFGLDPGRTQINLLMVNDKGLPTGGFGVVEGHFVEFKNRCPGSNEDGCRVGIRIEAKPDANINYMWIGNNLQISMRRVAPGKAAGLDDRLKEVTSEESEEEIARAEEDAREEREALALVRTAPAPAPEGPGQQPPAEVTLDEVVVDSELERQRQAQLPRRIADPDIVTVTRNSNRTGKGSIRVRLQIYTPQREIRLRASDARQLAEGANPSLALQRDRLATDSGSRIRSATLDFTASLDEADGLPAHIPISATTSLFNFDYVRLGDSTQPLMATLRNVMHPETRRCVSALKLGDGGEDFQNRFVLLGDRFADCSRTVNSREGDLIFADTVPPRLRQELRDLYDPVYNQFSRNLGSEPGIVFVIWRPESPRNDFRLVHSLNRTSLLVFNGPSWERGIMPQQRDALWQDVAQEQIARRIRGGDAITEAAADYLLMLARAERQQTTSRWLTTEVPDWIAACGRAMSLRASATSAPRGIFSYDCGLVVQFVYDAVARAKSKGEDSVMRTWRTLLADAYRRRQDGVPSGAFLDSSTDALHIVQGLLSGVVDWTAFAVELGRFGVELRVTPEGPLGTSVQVRSLTDFRD